MRSLIGLQLYDCAALNSAYTVIVDNEFHSSLAEAKLLGLLGQPSDGFVYGGIHLRGSRGSTTPASMNALS